MIDIISSSDRVKSFYEIVRETRDEVVFIVGGGILQIPFIDEVYKNGYIPVVFDINSNAPAFKKYSEDKIIKAVISTKAEEECLDFAVQVARKHKPVACATVGTDFSRTVAKIANRLNLPGNPYGVALATTNKGIMRTKLSEKGIPQPVFCVVEDFNQFIESIRQMNKDYYVVKPADNMGARGVQLVNKEFSKEELRKIFEIALQYSTDKKVIVEEYIKSYELSADALVVDKKVHITGIADRFILNPPNFIELGHLMPSVLPADLVSAASDIFIRAIEALGIVQGAAKGDIRVRYENDSNGKKVARAYIGEVASRLSGGFMSAYTYPYATGVNLMKLMLDVALGKKDIKVNSQWKFYSCELGLVSKKDGVLKRVENTYDALCVPYIKNVFILREENEKVVKTCNNVSKLGNVISQAPMANLAVKYCKKALSMLKPIYK